MSCGGAGFAIAQQWPGVNDHSPVYPLYRGKCVGCPDGWRGDWQDTPEEAVAQWRSHQQAEAR